MTPPTHRRVAALVAAAVLAVAVAGQYGDTLLTQATVTTRVVGHPIPGDPDQPAHQAGVGVGALPWITGWFGHKGAALRWGS